MSDFKLTNGAKLSSMSLCIHEPDFSNVLVAQMNSGTDYTATEDCFLYVDYYNEVTTIDGGYYTYSILNARAGSERSRTLMPIRKGTVIRYTHQSDGSRYFTYVFGCKK